MRKLAVLAVLFMALGLVSCDRSDLDPNVTFYMDGQEITTESITVPMNSYREIVIKAIGPKHDWHFYWQYATGYPVELANGSENFQLYNESWTEGATSSVHKMNAEFRMIFSDTVYHSGDECRLRVSNPDYQKVLKVVVE